MARQKRKVGELLVGWGLVSANDLADALKYATEHGKRIGEALIELELCGEDDVTKALATQFDMEFVDLDKGVVKAENLGLIPRDLILKHQVLPVAKDGNTLKVVITDPLNLETLDLLRFRLNVELRPVLASPAKVAEYIKAKVSETASVLEKTMASIDSSIDQDAGELNLQLEAQKETGEDTDAPIIRYLNLMITEAVRSRASDIHVEPMADRIRVRYRIDGVCIERDKLPKSMQGAVTARLKIMSGLDIAEKRVPQDGRIKMDVDGSNIDFRVSALPSYHGESVVMRILRPESVRVGIEELGFEQDDYERFLRIIKRPNGIFLVTGPTGSGKTTTLYAALQELNRPDKKIITAEDPVEYNFTGMNQCQVKEEIGLTFARILRAMLRQAPNIILVGEIRDREVGDVAIQAALTGHLVFSTLHTNDAPSAITRLIDMGIKPFLVASSIQAIMAQRLIRLICKECKVEDEKPDPKVLRLVQLTDGELKNKKIYKGRGCKACHGSGYRGRKGIFEMLSMTTELRELAFKRAAAADLRRSAVASGMRTLLGDGKLKILRGMTTPGEIARVAQAEGISGEEEE
ncbi:MAG: Flp pilus assembly complex ATPase component TadA [Phycisphaerales bacterium]|nr:MAG: Flp pilus assembly complex ATPase component TadA [Phycisphaerales bacterium]